METVLFISAVMLSLGGLAGCLLPGIPGPPLSYISLLLVQWAIHPYSITFLIVTGILTAGITVIDYYLPLWTAKKYGATRQGIIGSMIGMFAGIFFTPIGMIAGMVVGALAGDLMAGRNFLQAGKSAAANVAGTLLSIGLKLAFCGILFYYTVSRIVTNFM